MSTDKITRTLRALAFGPPMNWRVKIDRLSADERYELEKRATAYAEGYARLAVYLSSRAMSAGLTGIASQDAHDLAVKEQNRIGHRVRTALGFWGRRDLNF